MNSPKKSPAALRYFFARFQSLAKPKWLVPSGFIIVGSICAWQYWSHPEWLSANLLNSQPQSSNPDLEGSAGNLLDDPLERLALEVPDFNSAKPLQNNSPSPSPTSPPNLLTSPLNNPLNQGNSNSLAQLTQPLSSQGKSQLSPIFTPLIPNFKDTPVPSATDLLKSIASPPSVGQSSGSPLPTISVTNNPLQEAMRQGAANSGASSSPGGPPPLESQQLSQPQPVVPTYSPPSYNYGGQSVPNLPASSYNYGGQSVPNLPASSYNYGGQSVPNLPASSYNYGGQSVPNLPASSYNYGGQSVPNLPASPYNTQPPAATSQQPYANPNYGYGSQPVTPNQPPPANPNRQQQNSPFNSGIYRPF